MRTRVALNTRVPPEVYDKLTARAQVENRPLSNLVETILIDWLKQQGEHIDTPPPRAARKK